MRSNKQTSSATWIKKESIWRTQDLKILFRIKMSKILKMIKKFLRINPFKRCNSNKKERGMGASALEPLRGPCKENLLKISKDLSTVDK